MSKKEDINTLKINEDFKKRFEYNEKRKILEKAKEKYGKDLLIQSENEDDDDESEDSEAELINKQVMNKFLKTIIALDEGPTKAKELVNNKESVFSEEDFKIEKSSKQKLGFTVKDAILKYNPDMDEDVIEEDKRKKEIYNIDYIPKKEKDIYKEEFIKQAETKSNVVKKEIDENEKYIDDGFLIKRQTETLTSAKFQDLKPKVEKVGNGSKVILDDKPLEEVDIKDIIELKKKKDNLNQEETLLLKQFIGNESSLSAKDKFLRKYIVSEAWKEKDSNVKVTFTKEDEEDDEKSELFDNFESLFNFRYQEQGGINITTHKREDNDVYKQKDNKRSEHRKEVKERKNKDKEEKLKEINIAKEFRKEEMMKKVDMLIKVLGEEKRKDEIGEKLYKELEKEDFNEDEFEVMMNEIFNNKYYKEGLDFNKEEKELFDEDKGIVNEDVKEVLNEEENENYNEVEEENHEDEWWYCDLCSNIIKPGGIRYDCTECEDLTYCKKCYKQQSLLSNKHHHKMKKQMVPASTIIPDDWKELIKGIEEENILKCTVCEKDISEAPHYFICEECEQIKICGQCRGKGKTIHEHDLKKYKVKQGKEVIKEENNGNEGERVEEKIKKKISEKLEGNYTDIVSNVPMKFKYVNVSQEEYGLNDDMLVYLSDKTLNTYVNKNWMAPYNENKFKVPYFKLKSKEKMWKGEVERNKKSVLSNVIEEEENIERNVKLLVGNKRKEKKAVSNDEVRNKRRLDLYGIEDENEKEERKERKERKEKK